MGCLETTFVMLKPDCVARGLVGEVLSRLERKFKIVGLRMAKLSKGDVEFLYDKFKNEDWFWSLSGFMLSDRVVLAQVYGEDAISEVRLLLGAGSYPKPGTIRGDLATTTRYNIIHASDCSETAKREMGYFFKGDSQGCVKEGSNSPVRVGSLH